MKLITLIISIAVLYGCGGCPKYGFPVYKITVYDQNTKDVLCVGGDNGSDVGSCNFEFSESLEIDNAQNISVSLVGFERQTLVDVENRHEAAGCYDYDEITTNVDIFLVKE